jgi:co-chaperonin GroES (HSP10)
LYAKPYSRGSYQGGDTLTYISADEQIRPLRDHVVIELEEEIQSKYILVEMSAKPLEGVVLAIGPGTYPKRYDRPEKHLRSKIWDSKAYLATEVKVGERVKLGDGEITNNAFQRVRWGAKHCIICREVDICGVVDTDRMDTRPVIGREAVHRRKLSGKPIGNGRTASRL